MRQNSEIYPNIFKIPLPIPGKKPGPVNAYIFIGENITLLDTGIVETARELKKALNEYGLQFSDIDQIILTHGHIDHYGAARKIVKAGRTKVASHFEDRGLIETGEVMPKKTIARFLRLMGVPIFYLYSLWLVMIFFKAMAQNCKVDKILKDGDKIRMGDYTGTVIETPGHTGGSICIYLENEDILFSGDHILGHITPNAFVMLEKSSTMPKRLSQVEFYDSIEKIENISPSKVFPGHGDEIVNLKETIEMYRTDFSERKDEILKIIGSGEQTAYEIARKLFPEIGGLRLPLDIYLTISEVYTHIQILQRDGIVDSFIKDNRMMFGII